MNALFAIIRQKAKQKLQAVTARTYYNKKEKNAKIAAIYASANIVAPVCPI